jgi:poly(hydroxyalkanoate) depolymerase family esterase
MASGTSRTAAVVVTTLLTCLVTLLVPRTAHAASLQEVRDFGYNPSGIRMFVYVPNNVAAKPAVVVGIHWCHGTAQDFYTGTQYAQLADQYGFIVIYPSAVSSDGCWDVHSKSVLTHNGDAQGIVSMVKYVQQHHNGDPSRTFVTGHSSGGMMTNVLLGSYPDVFQAGAAFAGVPFGCFAGSASWNTDCAEGRVDKTAQQWGDLVRGAYPGYTGPRPRVQLWHGTEDQTLSFANFGEAIKQWTNVLGVSTTPTSTEYNNPSQHLDPHPLRLAGRGDPGAGPAAQPPDPRRRGDPLLRHRAAIRRRRLVGRRAVQPVPRRRVREPHQRRRGAAVGLQRGRQPAVDDRGER